ncbi:MAG: class II aldolase/adducin family protein [Thermodesulfobacteriota bacterium]
MQRWLEPVAMVRAVPLPGIQAPAVEVALEIVPEYRFLFQGLQPGQFLVVVVWSEQEAAFPGVGGSAKRGRPNPVVVHRAVLEKVLDEKLIVSGMAGVDGALVLDIHSEALPSAEVEARICSAGQRCWRRGLTHGISGNLSLKTAQGMRITRSGAGKGHLRAEDILCIDAQGHCLHGQGVPSSEWPLHQALYQAQGEALAIVHVHPPACLALALREPLQAALEDLPLYESAVVCSQLAVVPALKPGSPELAEAVAAAATRARVIFLTAHGLVCWGTSLEEAVDLLEEVETLARIRLDSTLPQLGE